MSPGPEELTEIHDEFMEQIRSSIPIAVLDEGVGPGTVEDDLVRAVQLLTRLYRAERRIVEGVAVRASLPEGKDLFQHITELATKAWVLDNPSP